MQVQEFFDRDTSTLTYVVFDAVTRDAIVIDPVLDYDQAGSQTSTSSVERVAAFVTDHALRLHFVLETHAHADHLSASQVLEAALRREGRHRRAHPRRAGDVQGRVRFTRAVQAGRHAVRSAAARRRSRHRGRPRDRVIATPGHTPACVTYAIDDAIFTGDALFIEDSGTGRCDFPRGSADELYTSVHDRLYALPDDTRVFIGHDYQPGGRPLRFTTTIGAEKRENTMLKGSTSRDDFVRARNARDATLKAPKLLLPSVQVNIDAGRLPESRANGKRYLSIPLNPFEGADER